MLEWASADLTQKVNFFRSYDIRVSLHCLLLAVNRALGNANEKLLG